MSTVGPRDYRPKIHFSARKNWINDPNGLIFFEGKYHMFFQYSPGVTTWGPMHWGHAVSTDLIHWEEKEIALFPDALGTIFSGCAVLDTNNTSGFGALGKAPLVLIFTHNQPPRERKIQQQSIAYSLDGEHFRKYKGNPVIPNPGIRDFRDPKVFWNKISNKWCMVLAVNDCVHFYASDNLIDWEKSGEFGHGESRIDNAWWECPDLFELACDDGTSKWVLIVSRYIEAARGGSKIEYFVGDFDGKTFYADKSESTMLVDAGFDYYAATSFSQVDERILMAWSSNWVYADKLPTNEYCGIMALPRKFCLKKVNGGYRLAQQFAGVGKCVCDISKIKSGSCLNNTLFGLRIKGNGPGSVTLRNARGEELKFGVNDENEVFIDRSRAGYKAFDENFGAESFSRSKKKRECSGGYLIELVFDVSICELLCDDGVVAITQTMYPTLPYDGIEYADNLSVEYIALSN